MTIFAYICIVVAAIWILYKIYVAYMSYGGTVMVSVYDAAIYPPFLAIFGLYWVKNSDENGWAVWVFAVVWLSLTLSVIGLIRIAEEVGDRRR